MWVAAEGGFEPRWTERIFAETRRSLLGEEAVTPEQWDRLRTAMSTAFPDAMLDQETVDAIKHQMPNNSAESLLPLTSRGRRAGLTVAFGGDDLETREARL